MHMHVLYVVTLVMQYYFFRNINNIMNRRWNPTITSAHASVLLSACTVVLGKDNEFSVYSCSGERPEFRYTVFSDIHLAGAGGSIATRYNQFGCNLRLLTRLYQSMVPVFVFAAAGQKASRPSDILFLPHWGVNQAHW